MTFKTMIETARAKGVASEDTMWTSIETVDAFLEQLKEESPKKYWCFLHKLYEKLFGCHYEEELATHDIENLAYTDKSGVKHTGAHWKKEEVLSATTNKTFPSGVTSYDKWVAYNSAYADFCKKFGDTEILEIAYLFYFADEDYEGNDKIWRYMCAMQSC